MDVKVHLLVPLSLVVLALLVQLRPPVDALLLLAMGAKVMVTTMPPMVVKLSCSVPKPPMEKFVKMGVQLQEQWRQTIASANAPNSWKVQIAKSAQVACIFSITIVSLAEKETITVVHRVNSKVVQCVRVSLLHRSGVVFLTYTSVFTACFVCLI